MLQTRKATLCLARRLNFRPQRRHESNSSKLPHDTHSSHSQHSQPVNEHFGRNFFITIAALPLGYAVYRSTQTNDPAAPPLPTRLLDKYTSYQDRWAQRNALHTAAVERAAFDRNLFQSSQPSRMVDLKFPEVFNMGSPYNVHAGQGADLEELIEHYARKNREMEEKIRNLTPEEREARS